MSGSATGAVRAHVVLGSGGVRTLSYVGALEALAEAGIEFASVSACSAGSLVGALVASGMPMAAVRAKVESTDLRRLISRPTLPGPLRYARRLRWPFAPYDSEVVVDLMRELLGGDLAFGDLKLPFATAGIDLLSRRLLVYAQGTHDAMKVADAVRIAVGIPLLFPPHDAGGRVVVDAAIATQCPVWMVGRFDDELPILALKPADAVATAPPRGPRAMLAMLLGAGVACRDQYLLDEIPRARLIEIPVPDLAMDDFAEAERRKPYLIEAGRRVALACLREWGADLAAGRRSGAQRFAAPAPAHDDRAVATASALMLGFANRLSRFSRQQLFISYSRRDRPWVDVIRAALDPYVELRGLQVWDDSRIEAGETWREAIDQALAATRVALLLVSPGFLASAFIRDEELRYFLDAATRRAVTVHWLLLSAIDGAANPLADRQALLDTAVPLDRMTGPDLVRALAAAARTVATDLISFDSAAGAERAGAVRGG